MLSSMLSVALFSTLALAAPAPKKEKVVSSKYPFTRMVAFGDNLSDNGNGSYAWCIAAPGSCNNKIYGYKTWTDGPVAVSYLSDLISTPLTNNFAIGHASGGSKFGSTIDNNFTQSPADVPSAVQQIANYTGHSQYSTGIGKTLHFLWTGNNDIEWAHADPTTTNHNASATAYAALMKGAVQNLVNSGAKYIFVPNIYPKHIAPVMTYWTDPPPSPQRQNVADAIQSINSAVEVALKPFGTNVLYYDVYSYMLSIWNNPSQYNITHTTDGAYCDGYSQADWNECVTENKGYLYYWMQDLDMTTYVHKFIAQDMANVIKNHNWTSSS